MTQKALFALVERIYTGSFSVVHRARDVRTLREVVVKRCCDDAHARREFYALSGLAQRGCRNVAALELDRLFGDSEVDPGGLSPGPFRSGSGDHPANIALTLYDPSPPPVCGSDLELRPVLFDVLRALADIHAAGYVHCDVKRENLVTCREEGGVYRLIDFGLAVEAPAAAAASRSVRGTPFYMAPELARLGYTTPLVDEYAAGVLAYSLLHGLRHFAPGVNGSRSGLECARAVAWSRYSPDDWSNGDAPLAADLCAGLLRDDPRARTTARRALEHPLFDGMEESK